MLIQVVIKFNRHCL